VRLGHNRAVSRDWIRNELLIDPVVSLRRPHSEAAQYLGLWVPEPSFEP
jgi:hypothetical protein